jgi:hypothetical protein
VTNENLILEEIKGRLNSGKACYHSVQNVLNIQNYNFSCGSICVGIFVPGSEGGLKVFENRALRRIFGREIDKII